MLVYLDSSVALRAALPGAERGAWRDWLDHARAAPGTLISSRLLRTEMVRVLRREGLGLGEGAKVLSRLRLLRVTEETFAVAESIERHIKTLDAVHLATALLVARPLVVVTHDRGMLDTAAALGLAAFDPVHGGAPRAIPATPR